MNNVWIRNPVFDAFWIMSGIPIGIMLIAWVIIAGQLGSFCSPTSIDTSTINIFPQARCDPQAKAASVAGVYLLILFDLAHTLSPICLAWSHRTFRAMMVRRWSQFVAMPIAMLSIGLAIGILSERYFPDFIPFRNAGLDPRDVMNPRIGNPFWWLLTTYVLWNTYHFAKQNFGIMTIYKIRSRVAYPANQRKFDLSFSFVAQITGLTTVFILPYVRSPELLSITHYLYTAIISGLLMVVVRDAAISGRYWTPRIMFAASQAICLTLPGILVFAANGLNHWLAAIGLSSHVDANANRRSPWIFASIVIAIGIVLFWAFFLKSGASWSWNLRAMSDFALPYVGVRLALGMVHFLYDRWVWRLSDPLVRATIGADLLRRGPAPLQILPFPALAE